MVLKALLAALALLGLLGPPVQAAPPKITIAIGSDSVPYYFQGPDGVPQGLLVDLWRTWSQKTGVPVKFLAASFRDSLRLVREGKAEVHAGCFVSPQRRKYLDFIAPVVKVQTNFFVQRNIYGVQTLQDLRAFRIGLIAGDYAHEFLQQKLPQAALAIYPNNHALFDAIQKGDVKVFIKDTAIALSMLAKLGIINQYRFDMERPLYARDWYCAVRKGDQALPAIIRQGMALISAEERAAIELRWVHSSSFKVKDRLVIACSKGYTPFTFLSPAGRPSGLLVDIWRLWAQKTGKQIEFSFSEWEDSLKQVQSGLADMHSGLGITDDRLPEFDYSQAFYGVKSGIFFNLRRLDISRPQDLAGLKVAVVAGSANEQYLRREMPRVRLSTYPDSDALIHAVGAGEAQIFLEETAVAMNGLDRLGERGSFERLPGWQTSQKIHAAVKKGNRDLLALVEAGFQAISPREMAVLEKRWIRDPELQYHTKAALAPQLNESEKTWLKEHKVIVLGGEANWPPLEFVSPEGVRQGLAAEYLKLLEQRLGIRLKVLSAFSWADMLQMVKKKQLGGMSCIARSKERESYLIFTKPYFYCPYMVFTKRDHPAIKSIEELAGKTIAVENGFFLHDKIKGQFPRITLLPVPDTLSALKAVVGGKAQAYVGNLMVAEYLIKRHSLGELKITCTPPWPGTQLRIGIRRDWPQLVSILDKALDTITSEEQDEINSKWLTPSGAGTVETGLLALTPKERSWLEKHRRIRLGVDPSWPPFEFYDQQGTYAGMVSDYVRIITKKLGIAMKPVPGLSWDQAIAKAKAGEIDVFPCISKTPERRRFLNFTKPYLSFPMVIVTSIDAPFITDLKDLIGKTVAVGQGYASQELLVKNHPGLKLKPVSDIRRGLKEVSQGKVEAFVGNLAVVTYHMRNMGLTNLKIAGATPYSFDLCFGVRKDWPEMVGILDKCLADISPRQKADIHNAWISMRFEHGVDWEYVWRMVATIVAVSVVIMFLILYWNTRLQRAVRQRRMAEEALSKSESQLRALLDSSADTIIAVDPQRRIIKCNPAFTRQFGYSCQEVLGQSVSMIHPVNDSFERFGREVYPQINKAGFWRGEWLYRRKDGTFVPMETVLSAYQGPEGTTEGFAAVMRDITERKLAEEEVRNSQQRLAEIIDFLPDPTFVVDNQGVVVSWNRAMEEITGIPAAGMLGQGDYAYAVPFYGQRRPILIDLVRQWDETYREKYISIKKVGERLFSESWNPNLGENGAYLFGTAAMLYDSSGTAAGAIESLRDITELKKVELALEKSRHELEKRVDERTADLKAAVDALRQEVTERQQMEASLRKSEEEHRAVLDASPNCIIAYDTEGRAIYANLAFTKIFGWTQDEVIGKRINFVPPENKDETLEAIKKVYDIEGGVYSFESRRYTKSGDIIDVSINAAVYLDPMGSPIGMLVNLADISERKRTEEELRKYRQRLELLVEERTAELEVAMEKAQEADRLKSAFLASMSHELRTPLNSIIGFTGIILQGLVGPLNEEQTKQMGKVQHSARHLLSLINDVLDISKIEAGQLKVEYEEFDMVQLMAEVENGLKPLADQKGLKLECRLAPQVGKIVSDRRRVEQILINLLNNAIKFTDQGGVYLDCGPDNGFLLTRVQDTGIGIKREDLHNLFKPFRQIDTGLSRRYEGTGLGLNICKRLVDLLGGEIWAESGGAGAGSTFSFTLPLTRGGGDG
jgi:PAS domain S-box-containing protein